MPMETPVSGKDISRFRRLLVPGGHLDAQAALLSYRRGYASIEGITTIDGNTAAEGGFISAVAEE